LKLGGNEKSGGAEDEVEEFAVEKEDGGGDGPGDDSGQAGVGKFSHFGAAAGELDERYYRERQLKTEDDLAEDEKRGYFVFTGEADDDDGRKNSDTASNKTTKPGLEANFEKPLHDDLAGESAGERGVLSGGEKRDGKNGAGETDAENGTEEFVSIGNFGDVVEAARMKGGGAKDEDCGVDEERKAKGQRGIENGVAQGFAAISRGSAKGARLHDAGVEIEIVRHHGGAEDAYGDVKHLAVAKELGVRDEAACGFAPERLRPEDFVGEAGGNAGDERDNESFDEAEAASLQGEDDEYVQRGDEHTGEERESEEKLQRDGRAQDFSEVAGGDGDFANDPEKDGGAAGIMFAAGLGEIAPRGDAEFRGERLKKHRHQIAEKDDAEKRIAEFGAAGDVGGPIAGVHVADGDEVAGASEGENFAEPGSGGGNGNCAVRFGERRKSGSRAGGTSGPRSGGGTRAKGGFSLELWRDARRHSRC
jgi:hypothetical protein